MSHRYVFSGALALVVASSLLSSPAWADPLDPVQPPPSLSSLVAATNAMLQPGDVTGTLAESTSSTVDELSTGFINPPGRGDLDLLCDPGPRLDPVLFPSAQSTGFTARSGLVNQFVYQYESQAAAQRAWATLSDDMANRCNSASGSNGSDQNSAERIAGIDEPGWALVGGDLGTGYVAYTTMHLLGDSIQRMSFNNEVDGNSVLSSVTSAAQELSVVLAQRWLARTSLPLTQNPTLTRAELSALRPGDVPSSLPVLLRQSGAWSDFDFRQPGSDAFAPCVHVAVGTIPRGEQFFQASLGGTDFGPSLEGTPLSQSVSVYATQEAAQQAWDVLTRQAQGCSQGENDPVAGNEDLMRLTNGVSELTFGGVPGIWVRELATFGGNTGNFRVKTYSIYLLMGDAIQQVSYATSEAGLGQVQLDQLPVNQIAEDLANRWVVAGAQ
jgi:hypothetical protein